MRISVEKHEHIWTVIIDRPEKKNAVDRDAADGLYEAFAEFDRSETARVAVLWGRGGNLDMILTGRSVDAQEALEMGLANYVVQQGSARQEAERLAEKIAEFPQLCLRSDRHAVYSGLDQTLLDGMAEEFRLGLQVIQSGESSKGARRFVDRKR